MSTIRVVLVDDHKIIRDGLKAIFKSLPHIEVVGDVDSGEALLELLINTHVDVVLLDMHMPIQNGIEVTRELKALYPDIRVLINTMSELTSEIEGAVAVGVNGYVLKTTGSDELIKAIEMVANGRTYYGSEVIRSFIKAAETKINTNVPTPTELKIITLLYEEKRHHEISELLSMAPATLSSHFQNMYRKFRVKTEIGLVKYALSEKLIGKE